MEKYLSDWLRIIEEMKNDNTYKTAWGKGIVETIYLNEIVVLGNKVIIKQSDIANKMIKYYWNQTFFFGLSQGHNPVIVQIVQEMIEDYKSNISTYPVPWNEAEKVVEKDVKKYNKNISKIISNARTNVCPRFKNVSNKEVLDIYDIDTTNKTLIFDLENIKVLKEYTFVLSKLFNYKWSQLLERYNTAPNITSKVNASSERKIKRKSLNEYKKLLLEYYHTSEIRDFYTGEIVDINDIHIDHVIPWSFVYSDDIWNLVITKSTNNLIKSNRPPTKLEIIKLKKRNEELLKVFKSKETKFLYAINYSIENKILDKLYVNLKG